MLIIGALIILSKDVIVLSDINLAINRRVTYCDMRNLSNVMVDGERSFTSAERINEQCVDTSYIKIYLDREYHIHYVLIFEGAAAEDSRTLDYFMVFLISILDVTRLCSRYPKRSRGPGFDYEMRVNCDVVKAITVKVQSQYNEGFIISEIEVYTMHVFLVRSQEPTIYHGCFRDNQLLTKGIYPYRDCINLCGQSNNAAALFWDNSNCYCSNMKDGEYTVAPTSDCYKYCGDHYCGGDGEAYSVYISSIQLPFHVSCYFVGPDLEGPLESSANRCYKICKNSYFAAFKGGMECICTNSTRHYNITSGSSCDSRCELEPTMACGGYHHASIYGITSQLTHLKSISLLKCNSKFDQYGICMDGCQDGYIGDYCLDARARLCVDVNPCVHETNTQCTTSNPPYACLCLRGFYRNNTSGPCYDINECLSDLCNVETTNCINLIGSYECECMDNLIRFNITYCVTDKMYCEIYNLCARKLYSECAGDGTCVCINRYIEYNEVCVLTETCANVDPCVNKSNSRCVKIGSTFKCPCIEGYIEVSGVCEVPLETCENADLCVNVSNSRCVRIFSNNICLCIEGYFENSGLCDDIDECECDPCNNRTSTCVNLNGSYHCLCRPNYFQLTEFVCISNDTNFELPSQFKIVYIFFIISAIFLVVIGISTWCVAKEINPSTAITPSSIGSPMSYH